MAPKRKTAASIKDEADTESAEIPKKVKLSEDSLRVTIEHCKSW
jgi:hypothetical protein